MMESWIVSILIGAVTIVFGYGVSTTKSKNTERELREFIESSEKQNVRVQSKIDTQLKRVNEVATRCTRIESLSSQLLSIKTAEEKFITRNELELHVKSIEKEMSHLSKNSDVMVGKLDNLTTSLSEYILNSKASNAN